MKLRKFVVNISLVLASLVFCALAIELGLRFVFPVYESAASSDYERDNLRVWAPRPNTVSQLSHPDTGLRHLVIQNDLGLRQSRNLNDLSATINLAFFGDSFTANKLLPAQYSFTEPLDYLLNRGDRAFNVLNFGVAGYGTDQEYFHYLEASRQIRLQWVFYVLCANDLRNIYETNLFSVNSLGQLVRNPVPRPAWWIALISRLHTTYLALDLYQRLVHFRAGNLEMYRAEMEQTAARDAYLKRFHDERADGLQRDLLAGEENEDLARTILIFKQIMEKWRDAARSNGAKFYVVLLPTGSEEVFKSFLEQDFQIVSLRDLFTETMGTFEWRSLQFKTDNHWAEEGNRLAALHLYKVLAADLGLAATAAEDPEQSLITYYSAFPNGWMPAIAQTAVPTASHDELALIRKKYSALEVGR